MYYDQNLHTLSNGKRLRLELDIIVSLLSDFMLWSEEIIGLDAQQPRLVTIKLEDFCSSQRPSQLHCISMKQTAIEDRTKTASVHS